MMQKTHLQTIYNKSNKYGIELFIIKYARVIWTMKIYSGRSADNIRETELVYNVLIIFIYHVQIAKRVTRIVRIVRIKIRPKVILHCKLRKDWLLYSNRELYHARCENFIYKTLSWYQVHKTFITFVLFLQVNSHPQK